MHNLYAFSFLLHPMSILLSDYFTAFVAACTISLEELLICFFLFLKFYPTFCLFFITLLSPYLLFSGLFVQILVRYWSHFLHSFPWKLKLYISWPFPYLTLYWLIFHPRDRIYFQLWLGLNCGCFYHAHLSSKYPHFGNFCDWWWNTPMSLLHY